VQRINKQVGHDYYMMTGLVLRSKVKVTVALITKRFSNKPIIKNTGGNVDHD
jgi:hypothetical protein